MSKSDSNCVPLVQENRVSVRVLHTAAGCNAGQPGCGVGNVTLPLGAGASDSGLHNSCPVDCLRTFEKFISLPATAIDNVSAYFLGLCDV